MSPVKEKEARAYQSVLETEQAYVCAWKEMIRVENRHFGLVLATGEVVGPPDVDHRHALQEMEEAESNKRAAYSSLEEALEQWANYPLVPQR